MHRYMYIYVKSKCLTSMRGGLQRSRCYGKRKVMYVYALFSQKTLSKIHFIFFQALISEISLWPNFKFFDFSQKAYIE